MVNLSNKLVVLLFLFFLNSCSTLESSWDSVKDASNYVVDSVMFWEDEEPEEDEAIIVEEVVETPRYANPQIQNFDNKPMMDQYYPQQNIQPPQFYGYGDPVYRSSRQYYNVSPNGSPMPAPPPPPFPQYSIDQNYQSYTPSTSVPNYMYEDFGGSFSNQEIDNTQPMFNNQQMQANKKQLTLEEEMELYGIENNCIRVTQDYMNGGFMCDDFD